MCEARSGHRIDCLATIRAIALTMAPKLDRARAIAFANNKGGSGKTFMAFQLACEAARSRSGSKVLVIDFSLYSDISALLLGGSARAGIGAAMKGLQTCVDATTDAIRAEGLVRALEAAAMAREGVRSESAQAPRRSSVFGSWFARGGEREPPGGVVDEIDVDLTTFTIRPHDYNPEIPENLYLCAGAGLNSWGDEHAHLMDVDGEEVPLWARQGDEWVGAGQVFRDAVERLPKEFGAVMIDTDHLAACVLTKLAFSAADSIVIPLSYNDMDFNRLFSDGTGNSLFSVLLAMDSAGMLKARIRKLMFTRVGATANTPIQSPGGIASPFTPTKTSMAQMDDMARQIWSVCNAPAYRNLFSGIEDIEPTEANAVRTFMNEYFGTLKLMPELASLISTMNGIPVCNMTTRTYTAANGLSGNTSAAVLNSLKSELSTSTRDVMDDDRYNAPISSSEK